MKKNIISAIAVASMTLTGCAKNGITEDTSPIVLKKDDSFAMQVLKSGFGYVPFDIKDTELPEDAYQATVGYGSRATMGLVSGGVFGAIGSLPMSLLINAGGSPQKDYIQYVAWVPADSIDITNTKAIDEYVKKNYFKPAVEAYFASEKATKLEHPAELVDYANGEFKMKGEVCYPVKLGEPKYEGCQMLWTGATLPIRYATAETGLPFKPSVEANRYIVVRVIDASYTSAVILPHLKTDMMYAYVPSMSYKAEHVNRLAVTEVASNQVPYVAGKDGSGFLFVKAKKD